MESSQQSAGDSAISPASEGPQTGNPSGAATALLVTRDGSVTIGVLIDAYMGAYSGRDTSRVQRLAFWSAQLGAIRLADISDDEIFLELEQLAARRGRFYAGKDAAGAKILKPKARPVAPATLNRYQAALSAVFTWAQKRRIAPKNWQNPCRQIGLRAENNERVRYLTDTERAALLAACKRSAWPRLYTLVLMALTTGARRGELEALRWRDVDLERAEAAVNRTKNNDRKVLPLVPAVVEQLTACQGAAGALVFASALAQSGATLLEIADVLGHRQLSVTKRYSHLATAHKSRLVNRVLGDIR